jgi:hypothetical protein
VTAPKRPRRNWVATHENEQIVVSRADGFVSTLCKLTKQGKVVRRARLYYLASAPSPEDAPAAPPTRPRERP